MLKRNNIYYYDNNSIIMKYINTYENHASYEEKLNGGG